MTLHGLDLQRALAAAKGWHSLKLLHGLPGVLYGLPPNIVGNDLDRVPNWHTDPALALELTVELSKLGQWWIDMTQTAVTVHWLKPDRDRVDIHHDNTAAGLRVALCEAIGNAWLEGKK